MHGSDFTAKPGKVTCVTGTKALLLGGPTDGIQPDVILQIGRVISCWKSKGDIVIILVERLFDIAFGLADLFHVLRRRGKLPCRSA